jgi:hypothetical protein
VFDDHLCHMEEIFVDVHRRSVFNQFNLQSWVMSDSSQFKMLDYRILRFRIPFHITAANFHPVESIQTVFF